MGAGSKLAFGAIVGAAVGVVAGVLTAPKSGKETREDLMRKAGDAKDTAAKTRDEVLFKAEELSDDIRIKLTDIVDGFTSSKDKKDTDGN